MTESPQQRNPVEELAERFLERYRRGERPSLSEYTRAHPELAQEICDLFPALVMMEEAGPRSCERALPSGQVTANGQELRRLGDYRILRQVGRGGMGVVYEAEQETLGRHVALKVLPFAAAADPTRLQRFRREARAVARLHHTNIVPVFDVGVEEGVHYYAMQFIQGQSLDDVLTEVRRLRGCDELATGPSRGPVEELASGLLTGQFQAEPSAAVAEPPQAADAANRGDATSEAIKSPSDFSTQSDFHYYRSVARVGLQVAEALAYAHGQKVLHRDIKPSNLLLDLQGIIWVTDFGLAKGEGEDLTQTGDVVGTLRYMAPERFKGVSHANSDLYSLGLTLYELLTLRPAFQESDRARLLWRIAQEQPPPPRKFDARLPRDLETIVLKAIAKEPARRYPTAEAMAEDLRRFLADRPIQARRISWGEQAWRWCRRNPGWAAMVGSVVGLLLVIGVGLSLGLVRLQAALDRAEQAELAAQEKLYYALVQQGIAISRSRRPGQRFESLAKILEAAQLARARGWLPTMALELRNAALAALAMPDLYPARSWEAPPFGETYVDFDETFTRLARTDRQGNCSIRQVADDREVYCLTGLTLPAGRTRPPFPILSRDGRFIIVLYQKGPAQLWQLEGPEPRLRLVEPDVWWAFFHPDCRRVAFTHTDGSISVHRLETGQELHRLPPDPSAQAPRRELMLALHPTQPLVAAGSYFATQVQIRHLETGQVLHTLHVPLRCSHVAWDPRGQLLALTEGDAVGIHLYDASTFQPVGLLSGVSGGTRVYFSHSGAQLLASGWEGSLQLFDVATHQLLFQHPPLTQTRSLRFHQNDAWLAAAFQQGRLSLWHVADGREYRTLASAVPEGEPLYTQLAIHPHSRLLAVRVAAEVNRRPGLAFWDLHTGECLSTLPQSGIADLCFESEPSGALLTTGSFGVFRWPVAHDPHGDRMTIGPPARLPLPPSNRLRRSRTGEVLVTAARAVGDWQANAGAWVLHPHRPDSLQRLDPTGDLLDLAVDPDGRWVAARRHDQSPVHIWDARDGRGLRQLQDMGSPQVSPDGRWLAVSGDEGHLYAVHTWEVVLRFRGWAVFSPDSNLLAVTSGHSITLVEIASGRELARLEEPNLEIPEAMGFTPDGSRLVTTSNGKARGVHVWDLGRLRAQLSELKLDWEAPVLPSLPREAAPLRLEVMGAEAFQAASRAKELLESGHAEAGAAELKQALALLPQLDWACDRLARLQVLGPPSLRNPTQAVALAQRARALCPHDASYQSTLGMAYYRAGQWALARDTLEAALRANLGWQEAHDCFFLALCHHQLHDSAKAKASYDRAVQWMEQRRGGLAGDWAAQLHALRTEAAAQLGLSE